MYKFVQDAAGHQQTGELVLEVGLELKVGVRPINLDTREPLNAIVPLHWDVDVEAALEIDAAMIDGTVSFVESERLDGDDVARTQCLCRRLDRRVVLSESLDPVHCRHEERERWPRWPLASGIPAQRSTDGSRWTHRVAPFVEEVNGQVIDAQEGPAGTTAAITHNLSCGGGARAAGDAAQLGLLWHGVPASRGWGSCELGVG
jgi:hypothetical protein